MQKENIKRRKFNIVNIYGNTQNVHPKILYFKKKLFGYKFWISYSPYPNHDSSYENPSIFACNKLYGYNNNIKNICIDDISINKDKRIYNSDPHIFYNELNESLELWWRYVDDISGNVSIKRVVTFDGNNFSQQSVIKENSRKINDYISLCILQVEKIIYIYYISKKQIKRCMYRNGIMINEESIQFIIDDDFIPWHFDIIYNNKKFELVVCAYRKYQVNHNYMSIYHSYSMDGVNFCKAIKILTYSDNFDNQGLYRPSLLLFNRKYLLLYSYYNKNNTTGLAFAYPYNMIDNHLIL